MDILALISVSNLSSNLVYCHLSVRSGLGLLISSKFINFSRGTNVLVDFYSSDENYIDEEDLGIGCDEVFNISISGCFDYQILNKSYDEEPIHLDANPSSILYRASFHNVNDLLSDDFLRALNLSSTSVILSQRDTPKISKKSEATIKSLITPYHDIQHPFGEDFINSTVSSRLQKPYCIRSEMCELPAVHKPELFQSVIYNFVFVLSLCFLYWVKKYQKKLSVIKQRHDMRNTATVLSGQKMSSCKAQQLRILLPSDDTECIKLGDSSLETQLLNTNLRKVSVEEEYYSMIESASENIASDCTAWEYDTTESESDSPLIDSIFKDAVLEVDDKLNATSISSSSNTSSGFAKYGMIALPHSNLTAETFDNNGHSISRWNDCHQIFPLPHQLNITHESCIPVSVDSIELAFLAGTRLTSSLNLTFVH